MERLSGKRDVRGYSPPIYKAGKVGLVIWGSHVLSNHDHFLPATKMREPERIDRICDLLKEKWKKYPDLRLGQFLMNYVFGNKGGKNTAFIFYLEDDITESMLKEM